MKRILIILFMLAFAAACGDNQPPVLTIEGRWTFRSPLHPDWVWDFRNGIVTQSAPNLNGAIDSRQYTYAERGDTLFLGGDYDMPPRQWLLEWHTADQVRVSRVGYSILPEITLQRTYR